MSEQTLSDRVAELEREREELKGEVDAEVDSRLYWERRFEEEEQSRLAAESRLAQARVDGAREALTRFHETLHPPTLGTGPMSAVAVGPYYFGKDAVVAFRDREYPAPPAAPEPLCDQCLQPLAADESRDHDNPNARRHTIRGCNRALGRALRRIVALAQTTEGK